MMGRGGDDIIDGDAWLNVRISVRQNPDGIRSRDRDLRSNAGHGSVDAQRHLPSGQLKAVREIKYANGPDFDTAVFTGPLANYSFVVNGVAVAAADLAGIGLNSVITVTDNVGASGIGDGIDRVMHVERLQFSDQSIVIGGLDNGPEGSLTISDPTPAEDEPLTVSIAGVTDADNISPSNPFGHITGPVSYFWQAETDPASLRISPSLRRASSRASRGSR